MNARVVVFTSGLHGKNAIIDERIVYTGSMNCSSNRGRLEEIHRIDSPDCTQTCSTQFKPDISGPRQGGRTALHELVPSVARHFRWLTSARPTRMGASTVENRLHKLSSPHRRASTFLRDPTLLG
jgi:phosphatidylserine/phosphatidylglycerophosphate/cardiolipin synthase-like enzyme